MRRYDIPRALAGMADSTPPGFRDESKWYVVNFTLTANQSQRGVVDIELDADFIWRAHCYASTSTFTLQFTDHKGFSLSNAPVASANYSNDPANPTAWESEITVPKRAKITIDVTDTSGAGNTVQIVLIGVHRFAQ